MHEKLFALEIKSKQVIPAEIAGTMWDFMLDKLISLIQKQGFMTKGRGTNICFLQKSLIKMVHLYSSWLVKEKNCVCQDDTKGQTYPQLF